MKSIKNGLVALCLSGIAMIAYAEIASSPVAILTPTNGITLHKSDYWKKGDVINGVKQIADREYPVSVAGNDPSGLRSISLSVGWSGAIGFYPAKYPNASQKVIFYPAYMPVQDWPIKSTVTNYAGVSITKTSVIHLLP